MTNLTEQYRKGELPSGWYYIKVNDELANHPVITECVGDYNLSGKFIPDFYEYDDDKIIEVLAPVPSFEQWIMTKNLSERAHLEMYKARGEKVRLEKENIKLKTENKWYSEQLNEAVKQNDKLKELLKEVQSKIRYSSPRGIETFADLDDTLLGKINQVLGE